MKISLRLLLWAVLLVVAPHRLPAQTSDRAPVVGILTLTAGPDAGIIKSSP